MQTNTENPEYMDDLQKKKKDAFFHKKFAGFNWTDWIQKNSTNQDNHGLKEAETEMPEV